MDKWYMESAEVFKPKWSWVADKWVLSVKTAFTSGKYQVSGAFGAVSTNTDAKNYQNNEFSHISQKSQIFKTTSPCTLFFGEMWLINANKLIIILLYVLPL